MEDKWAPINCFNKSGTDRFVDEMSSAGIPSIRSLIYDECWVSLTRNTTRFGLKNNRVLLRFLFFNTYGFLGPTISEVPEETHLWIRDVRLKRGLNINLWVNKEKKQK